MNKTIIIVDPRSSGATLAPTFNKEGYTCIAITLEQTKKMGIILILTMQTFQRL